MTPLEKFIAKYERLLKDVDEAESFLPNTRFKFFDFQHNSAKQVIEMLKFLKDELPFYTSDEREKLNRLAEEGMGE